MKKVFRQNPVAYFWQLFIWIFIIVLLLILFFVSGDYSKDSVDGNFSSSCYDEKNCIFRFFCIGKNRFYMYKEALL